MAKVRGKVFVFFGLETSDGVMGVKLTNAAVREEPPSSADGIGTGEIRLVSAEHAEGSGSVRDVRGVDRRGLCQRRAEAEGDRQQGGTESASASAASSRIRESSKAK